MTFPSLPLSAEAAPRVFLDWGRVESNADLMLPLVVLLALDVLARWIIRLDTRELPRLVGWVLTLLRFGTLTCLLLIYLEPEWRSEREVVQNSRVLLLVDTSSSMGIADVEASAAVAGSRDSDDSSRADAVARALGETAFLDELAATHDVVVFRFDEELDRLVSLKRAGQGGGEGTAPGQSPDVAQPGENGESLQLRGQAVLPDWHEVLAPRGAQTRLGEAMRELIGQERGSPISGVVVFSDGVQNAGIGPEAAIEAARAAKAPVYAVGVGSRRRAVNVRVVQLEAPPQAYPDDPYSVRGLIQAHGLAGRAVSVELLMREAEEGGEAAEPGSGVVVRQEEVVLAGDGEAVPVQFELTPTETGRSTICLRVRPPAVDSDPDDDFQEEEIAVVDRKTRVLLFAGGPTREYRFVRTLLYRDAQTTVDVLLGTRQPGISQEADRILEAFPATAEEMFSYDCLVAFDPDWGSLIAGQVDLLERWVAEQGGGMIVIPGPVFAAESVGGWVQDPALAKVQALYPVEFQRQFTVFDRGAYVADEPWPLDFTREGLEAAQLRLDDTATASQRAWSEFSGVFSYFPVRGPKPGATVLARFSDPRTRQGDQQPVFFAEQFYGSGRVFYIGSGEMWRLRRGGDAAFERLYMRLVRHVSQGRLLRQSSRGALLVGQDRHVVGSTVEIRARLTNARFEPLEAPGVGMAVFAPDGRAEPLMLRPDPSRAGLFAGQFTVLDEGTYRLELVVPEGNDERLTRHVKVSLPDLERRDPQRNDKLLSHLAQAAGGRYYPNLAAALGAEGPDRLVGQLKDRTKTIIETGAAQPPTLGWLLKTRLPASVWEQGWVTWLAEESWLKKPLDQTLVWWLMAVACGLLCCEWLIRRMARLA